ncbi:hypothetical protein [uncultured Pontibacter sp.]|uniref:hypothetical protein n=1 Tax=uncultured Pontibacter sp. TaxID=453356 RepID=UPI002637D993|nr:hypothetical protein [uncultured Pontibacter sp.]
MNFEVTPVDIYFDNTRQQFIPRILINGEWKEFGEDYEPTEEQRALISAKWEKMLDDSIVSFNAYTVSETGERFLIEGSYSDHLKKYHSK